MIAILLLFGCAAETASPALSIDSISCTPGESVEQAYTRAVYAARGLASAEPAEQWRPLDSWVQEGEILAFNCPDGGLVELLVQ